VAIRGRPPQFHSQGMIPVATIIAKEKRRPAVGGDQQVQVAVIIDIRVGRAPGNLGRAEGGPCGSRRFLESPASEVTKKVWRLAIRDSLLDTLNSVVDVAVGDKDVRPAVQIVVKEKTGEAKGQERSPADCRARSFVYKQAFPLVVIQRH